MRPHFINTYFIFKPHTKGVWLSGISVGDSGIQILNLLLVSNILCMTDVYF